MSAERLTIFDADRTLFCGPSTVWALAYLAQHRLLEGNRPLLEELEAKRNGCVEPIEYIRGVYRALPRLMGDIPKAELATAATETAEQWEAHVFPEMRDEISEARERGPCLIVSYGPDIFIRAFAKRLELQGARGCTLSEYVAHKPEKLTLARLACQEVNIPWETPDRELAAYGDSGDDFPLLRAADHPVLVNPISLAVAAEGERNNWRIMYCNWTAGEYGDLTHPLV